jgi:hypothetical protein
VSSEPFVVTVFLFLDQPIDADHGVVAPFGLRDFAGARELRHDFSVALKLHLEGGIGRAIARERDFLRLHAARGAIVLAVGVDLGQIRVTLLSLDLQPIVRFLLFRAELSAAFFFELQIMQLPLAAGPVIGGAILGVIVGVVSFLSSSHVFGASSLVGAVRRVVIVGSGDGDEKRNGGKERGQFGAKAHIGNLLEPNIGWMNDFENGKRIRQVNLPKRVRIV